MFLEPTPSPRPIPPNPISLLSPIPLNHDQLHLNPSPVGPTYSCPITTRSKSLVSARLTYWRCGLSATTELLRESPHCPPCAPLPWCPPLCPLAPPPSAVHGLGRFQPSRGLRCEGACLQGNRVLIPILCDWLRPVGPFFIVIQKKLKEGQQGCF